MPTPSNQHIVIVGAGPGGLAASLLLAKAGVNVTVVERSSKVGGRTKIIEQDGFKFDLGPTFFHYTEVIEEISYAYVGWRYGGTNPDLNALRQKWQQIKNISNK